jgi:hypothetical protein
MKTVGWIWAVTLAINSLFVVGSRAATPSDTGASGNSAGHDGLTEKFGAFTLSAGPATSGGFGAVLSGDERKQWLQLLSNAAGEDTSKGIKLPVVPYLEYSTDDTWNTQPGSLNQATIELQPGLDGAIFYGKWSQRARPKGPITCKTEHGKQICRDQNGNVVSLPSAPKPVAGYGFYGDLKYRYGTFKENGSPTRVNQLLGGAGLYLVLQRGLDQPWLYIWPRVSLTYYTAITTNTPVAAADLPAGIKENYLQLAFKTGVNFGPRGEWGAPAGGYPFRLAITYAGSEPTSGESKTWENLWTIQLSTDALSTNFRPGVTFQSGKNGGLTYDRQVLLGFVYDLVR